MNDDSQESQQPLRHAHSHLLRGAAAPPLRLAGADDEASVTTESHIVRGID
ncbi:hypothetical protein ACFU6R_28015 [Streptomyces sp. NPDC057499]|uniref:hypothetical protein n=1 Tax=Streptomyces sp. NPDC057499 TaxID=3346150 RepID=UPI003693A834